MARRIEVELVGDSRSLERAFARSEKSAKRFETQMGSTSRSLKSGIAGFGIGAGLQASIVAASDLDEQMAKTKVVFDTAATSVIAWSRTTTRALGVSQRQALATSSSFGALFAPMGIVGAQAAEQSRKLTELGADLASFYNTDVQSALDAIRSGLVGESEPLRRYGALLSETRVQQEAMAETGKDTASALTEQEKVLARINLIMRDTVQAHGDAARSSGRLSQQAKVLNAEFDDMKATVGAGLTPVLLGLIEGFNKTAGAISAVNQKLRDMNLGFLTKGAAQEGGLLDKLGLPHFGGGGPGKGDLNGSANFPIPGWTKGVGAAGPATAGSATPFFDAIDNIVNFTSKWVDAGKKFDDASKRWEATQKAAAARRARMELQRERFRQGLENQAGWLAFGVERAGATKTLADDRRALKKQEDWLKNRIRHEGRTLRLVSDLWRVRQQIRDLNKKHADKDPLAGLMQVSSKRLAQTLAAGTGIGPGGMGRLQANIAGQEIAVYTNVHLDGQQIATAVNRHNARGGARTARQTSGFRG